MRSEAVRDAGEVDDMGDASAIVTRAWRGEVVAWRCAAAPSKGPVNIHALSALPASPAPAALHVPRASCVPSGFIWAHARSEGRGTRRGAEAGAPARYVAPPPTYCIALRRLGNLAHLSGSGPRADSHAAKVVRIYGVPTLKYLPGARMHWWPRAWFVRPLVTTSLSSDWRCLYSASRPPKSHPWALRTHTASF